MKKTLAAFVIMTSFTYAASADPAASAWDVVATMAAALAEPNEYGFIKPFSKDFEHRERLENQVRALIQTNDIVSSVSAISNEGDDSKRTLEVDWYLEIKPQSSSQNLTQRHETIKMTMVKQGKRWVIIALDPVSFFVRPD